MKVSDKPGRSKKGVPLGTPFCYPFSSPTGWLDRDERGQLPVSDVASPTAQVVCCSLYQVQA